MLVPRPICGGSPPSSLAADPLSETERRQPESCGSYRHEDFALLAAREGMLQGVDQEFRHDQAKADRFAGDRRAGRRLHRDRERPVDADHRLAQGCRRAWSDRGRSRSGRRVPVPRNCCCTVATDMTRWCASCRCRRVSSDCTVRALSRRMLAMIWRLLATRCCISCSRISFCRSSSSFSRSASRRWVTSSIASRMRGVRAVFVEHPAGVEQHDAAPDRREFVLDLIGLDSAVLRDDVFEQRRAAPECSTARRRARRHSRPSVSSGVTPKVW